MGKPGKAREKSSRKAAPAKASHPDVVEAIEQAWPDREVAVLFDSEESWFWTRFSL